MIQSLSLLKNCFNILWVWKEKEGERETEESSESCVHARTEWDFQERQEVAIVALCWVLTK